MKKLFYLKNPHDPPEVTFYEYHGLPQDPPSQTPEVPDDPKPEQGPLTALTEGVASNASFEVKRLRQEMREVKQEDACLRAR